jgi:hypothetical protein
LRGVPPLPPPLPPETRTIGQLVAESLRLYGDNFLRVLPLGLPVAFADFVRINRGIEAEVAVFLLLAPVFSAAYVYACSLHLERSPSRGTWIRAVVVGTVVFVPAAFLLTWFSLAAALWFSLVGLAVPVVVIEGTNAGDAIERAFRLARADFVHALGSLATLFLVVGLMSPLLGILLQSQGDNTLDIAVFLADLVVSPLLFLGPALLYFDQEARSRIARDGAVPRR